MIDAATPLLGMVMRMRTLSGSPLPEKLYPQVVTDIQAIEQQLQSQGYEPGAIVSFRYVLCTFIDETALGLRWNTDNRWVKKSLLVHFHNESRGGGKVFVLIERLLGEPKRYLDLIEFIWLCLCLGYRGRYKVTQGNNDEQRGIVADFYSVTHLTPSSRLLPKYKDAWFYALSIDKTITGKNNYYIHFYNSQGEVITTPPGPHFRCFYRCIINNPQSNPGDICHLSPLLPDLLAAKNITACTPCYPPITDNKYYWNLLSHYSANGFMLSSVESVKQMVSDYILYQENDRQRSKQINQHLEGLTDINTALEDRLMKGKPYRCLSLTMTLNPEKFDNPGDVFMFTMHLYHFFPFCLSENMLLKMNVQFTGNDTIWHLAPYLLNGYKSLI